MSNLVIAGGTVAFVTGLLLHIVLPVIFGTLAAVVISVLAFLDPLYAGKRLKTTWGTLSTVLIIQVVHTFVTGTLTGGIIGYLAPQLQSIWLYPLAAILSALLHSGLFFLVAFGLSIIAAERNSKLVRGIALVIATVIGPLIGVVTVFVIRYWLL